MAWVRRFPLSLRMCSVVSLHDWLVTDDICVLPDMSPTVERFVRVAVARGEACLGDFAQLVCSTCVSNSPSQPLDCSGDLVVDLPPAAVERALGQYVIGAPARLLAAIIRRMGFAFLRHGSDDGLSASDLVACLYPAFEGKTVQRLMNAINNGGLGEFLTFADMLGMVGICREVSHLRVFKFLSSVDFRCGSTQMKRAAAETWRTELDKPKEERRRGEIVGHVITREDAGDSRLLDVLPMFRVSQPRAAVRIHGLHASMDADLAAAMVGDGCRHMSLSNTTVSRAHTFLLAAMRSNAGEVTVRSRAVRTLKLALTVKHANEGHGARYALLKLVLCMFPCLTTLEVCGPNNPICNDPEFEVRRIMTAPHGISPHLQRRWDPPVFGTLQSLRWDLAEVNGKIFLHLLAGFTNLNHCSIGENATMWKDRRNRIVRSIVLGNRKLKSLEVFGPLACELPHIDALVMRVQSTSDALPIIAPSTMLTVEARTGKQSDLAVLIRTHPRLAVRIDKCMDLKTTKDTSGRKRCRTVGMYDYRN